MKNINFSDFFSNSAENTLYDKNKALHLEWKKFIAGDNDIDNDLVSSNTMEEWMHCRSLGIDPLKTPDNVVLKGTALEEKLQRNQTFINISQPFIRKLFQFMKNISYAVALFDREGYVLKLMTEEKYAKNNEMFNFFTGTRWITEDAGNTCIARILETRKPVQMIGANHYLKFFHFITASGAPINDPDGELLGGIIVTTHYSVTHPHTLGMAMATAHAIENEWRAQKALVECHAAFEQTDVAYSLQKAIVSSIPAALITIDRDEHMTSVNDYALQMFGLEEANLPETKLESIFPPEENRFFWEMLNQQEALRDVEVRIRTAQRTGDFSMTCNPIVLSGGDQIGRILLFSEIKRIKSLVAKVIGAKANFTFKDICRQNDHFKNIVEQASVISQSTSNVLLLGESGTGKDIMAQAIHNASPRKDGPYVAINCAAIPRDLIASELFGYSEGAFTGSRRGGSQGKFELADGGTIFLDEIAETPLDIQAVLLRVIEDKCVVRIGGSQIRAVDVRIISATNRDLLAEVSRGNFRKDLYYRLNVFNIHLPPLRERPEDIPLLVEHFVKKYAKTLDKNITGAHSQVLEVFKTYRWPGNVRELQNVVERMVNYAEGDSLTVDLIPPEIIDTRRIRKKSLDLETPEDKEKRLIRHMLTLNLSKHHIAEQLDMSRATLYRKLKKYGLLGQ